MISIAKIYYGKNTRGDYLRYNSIDIRQERPAVVWNTTNRCNLNCIHCYNNSNTLPDSNELNTIEAKRMIVDLARNKIPVLLFSGGEPLLREDLFELISFAKSSGIKPVLSTNGTLINKKNAKQLKISGADYVGISLKGSEKTNDDFRRKKGSFRKSLNAITNCQDSGLRTGLRMTMTNRNINDLDSILDMVIENDISRACFYHLVNTGKASNSYLLSGNKIRSVIDRLIDFTKTAMDKIPNFDLLTVDNPADGPYIYLKLWKQNPKWAFQAYRLLNIHGGLRSSGVGIACVNSQGEVHPDQFWQDHSLGNVRNRGFLRTWFASNDPLIAELSNRPKYLKGRCQKCIWLNICGGGLRVRSKNYYGDCWADDPLCYLTDEEITKAPPVHARAGLKNSSLIYSA